MPSKKPEQSITALRKERTELRSKIAALNKQLSYVAAQDDKSNRALADEVALRRSAEAARKQKESELASLRGWHKLSARQVQYLLVRAEQDRVNHAEMLRRLVSQAVARERLLRDTIIELRNRNGRLETESKDKQEQLERLEHDADTLQHSLTRLQNKRSDSTWLLNCMAQLHRARFHDQPSMFHLSIFDAGPVTQSTQGGLTPLFAPAPVHVLYANGRPRIN